MQEKKHVVIVGGGAGGATVASLLLSQRPGLIVSIVEPSETHWYQPAWTLVGGGAFNLSDSGRSMHSCLPSAARWLRLRATGFDPERNRVALEDGSQLEYDMLVVAAGIQLNWGAIAGLGETLGKNGVTSNYRGDVATYTWQCLQQFRGERALFTQPAMPIKCAGAPQKILYMAADRFRRRGVDAELSFFTPGPSMFGVPFYAKALDKVVANYGITPRFGHNLIAVDGSTKTAVFSVTDGTQSRQVQERFDMIHVVPPQSAPDFLRDSPLAGEGGWMSVDKHSLQHLKYPNVFGLGDCTSTPNSKTAAAVRAQAPVVATNLLAQMTGQAMTAKYDGYASCPLTTSVGKIMLAEFAYDGVVAPNFPVDPRIPRRAYWWLKKSFLPWLYWRMLRGWLGPDWHRARSFPEAVPEITP